MSHTYLFHWYVTAVQYIKQFMIFREIVTQVSRDCYDRRIRSLSYNLTHSTQVLDLKRRAIRLITDALLFYQLLIWSRDLAIVPDEDQFLVIVTNVFYNLI